MQLAGNRPNGLVLVGDIVQSPKRRGRLANRAPNKPKINIKSTLFKDL
jgi:hypothetical protein